jgi:chromosome segregation ATPase
MDPLHYTLGTLSTVLLALIGWRRSVDEGRLKGLEKSLSDLSAELTGLKGKHESCERENRALSLDLAGLRAENRLLRQDLAELRASLGIQGGAA